VYGFAHPATGRSRFVILPEANTGQMGHALADFARWADPDGRKVLVLLVDRAGWHVARKLAVPPIVRLHHLPSCTPELQPAERLWPLVREGLANRVFDELPGMTRTLVTRCRWLSEHTDVVAGAVGFHWAVAARPLQNTTIRYEIVARPRLSRASGYPTDYPEALRPSPVRG
jgi:hypothetical protein